MRAFHIDRHPMNLPEGHRFPSAKYGRLRARVLAELPMVEVVDAPGASDGELALAHTPHYIDAVTRGLLPAAAQREIGFPWSEGMVDRSRRSVGATVAAARAALSDGVAASLAGGTHHASADKGGGYCVFNDVAVAARLMQAEWHRHHRSLLRVAVIDLDVHQGNGTARIFRDDPTVFTLSMHGAKNFPFRKETSDLDVELPDGTGDAVYLAALDGALDEMWRRHRDRAPGLIFYLAGADPHENDRLGRLRLTAAGLVERDRRVLSAAHGRGIPLAMSMAGGYGRDIDLTVAIQLESVRAAAESWQRWQDAVSVLAPSV